MPGPLLQRELSDRLSVIVCSYQQTPKGGGNGPPAFRHAGRKKGFALDARSHPRHVCPGEKALPLRYMGASPHTPGDSPRIKSSLLEEAEGVPREAWGGGHSPYSFCPH